MFIELILLMLITINIINYKNRTAYMSICLMMILLMVFTTDNADLGAYIRRYEMSEPISSIMLQEPIWGVLLFLCKWFKFSYSGLLLVICMISMLVMYRCLKRYSLMPSLVLSFYFVLFYIHYMIQLRADIAEWIVIYALLNLVEVKNFSTKKYVAMILFAAGIQFSTIFFLSMLIFKYRKDVRRKAYFYVGMMACVFPLIVNFLTNSSYPLLRGKSQAYLSPSLSHVSINTILFTALFGLSSFLVIRVSMKNKAILGEAWKKRFSVLAAVNIFSYICIGLMLIYNNNFFRYNRVVMIINIIILTNYYFERKRLKLEMRGAMACVASLGFVFLELAQHTWYFQITHNSILKYF